MYRQKLPLLLLVSALFLTVSAACAQQPQTPAVGGAAQFIGKIDVPASPYFQHPDFYNMTSGGSLTLLPHFPTCQQQTEYTCGPAAARMVMKYYGIDAQEEDISNAMKTHKILGTTTAKLAAYFTKSGWQVRSSAKEPSPKSYAGFLEFVARELKAGTPIMVENVEWGGHWRVIIGCDTMGTAHTGDDVLIMADPYDTADHLQDGYTIVPAEKFYYMWFDSQLFNPGSRAKQWVIAKPR